MIKPHLFQALGALIAFAWGIRYLKSAREQLYHIPLLRRAALLILSLTLILSLKILLSPYFQETLPRFFFGFASATWLILGLPFISGWVSKQKL